MKIPILVSALLLSFLSNAQNLNDVESVEYDAINHRFLASNGSSIVVVDGEGNEIEYFGSAPEADYGMEVMNEMLFSIVGSHVKAFLLSDGTEVMDYTVSGADFLNGMASDGDHLIWVTDFGAKKIHEIDVTNLDTPVGSIIVDNTVNTPNGITYDEDNNRLVFVSWGSSAKIKAIDLNDYSVTTLTTTSLSNLDGIDHDNNGNFFVSSWTPTRITKFSSDFTMDEIITAPGLDSPADICYASEIDTLAIPNSGNNTITFVGFEPVGIHSLESTGFMASVFPNPVSDSSVISFELSQSEHVSIRFTNQNGQIMKTWLDELLPSGSHKVLLSGLNLPSGQYIIEVKAGNKISTFTLVI